MTVDEFLLNSDALRGIYGHVPRIGEAIRVRSFNINWRGPTLIIRADLPEFPEAPPQEWQAAGLDTVQCHLQFLAVEDLSIREWHPPAVCRVTAVHGEEVKRLHIGFHGDGLELEFRCSDSVLVGHISAFRAGVDGSDVGPHSFVSRIDTRRHVSLPETWERTYYGRI
ncbi:Imm50 family immunity protein [Streptomyces sp. NPDC058145]|uniref:Imm50 family immunity protein n=1 Tax=Streptomyces sp. NPDC058145 TaxID=3346356 RepID=UPI0036EBED64